MFIIIIMKKNDAKINPFDAIWTREQEELLAEWSEKAACYRWLHNKSEKKFRSGNYAFTIPVIIMSTLTGTANFGIDSIVPSEHKQLAQISIGAVNIFAGLMSTLHNFLHYAENMEAHRNADLSWSKFQRNISVELALDPKRRKPAGDFLKISRAEYDRLLEQSPSIPTDIIKRFKKTFKKVTNIHKPDICNGIDPCKIYVQSKEEKAADILMNATHKLRGMYNNLPPNHHNHHNHHNHNNHNNHNNHYNNNDNDDNSRHKENKMNIHNELNDLKSAGKVSEFKNRLNSDKKKVDEEMVELNEIKDIIIDITDDNEEKGDNDEQKNINIELVSLNEDKEDKDNKDNKEEKDDQVSKITSNWDNP